mgnify:CR=1 FL=1
MRKKQKKQSESLRIAKLKHDKWLRSMGAHKDQRTVQPPFTIVKSPWEQDMGPGEAVSYTHLTLPTTPYV